MIALVRMREIFIGIVVGLLVGAPIGYSIAFPSFRNYEDQIEDLQSLVLDLGKNVTQLEQEYSELEEIVERERKSSSSAYSALESLYRDVEKKYSEVEPTIKALNASYQLLEGNYTLLLNSSLEREAELLASAQEINSSYTSLLNTLNIYEMNNLTRVVHYSITDAQDKSYTFNVGYGILWDVELIHKINRITISISWRRGELRGLLGITTYDLPKEHATVFGTIKTEIYDAADRGDVVCVVSTNYPDILRTGHDVFMKEV